MARKPNAYLSQVERGVIRRPDPISVWHLADLYGLNFALLMEWSDHGASAQPGPPEDPTTSALIKQIMNLTGPQRVRALALLEELARDDYT